MHEELKRAIEQFLKGQGMSVEEIRIGLVTFPPIRTVHFSEEIVIVLKKDFAKKPARGRKKFIERK